MNTPLKAGFRAQFSHAGWMLPLLAGASLSLTLIGSRDAGGTACVPVGRDLAWFCTFWSGVLFLLAGVTAPAFGLRHREGAVVSKARREVWRRFYGLTGFWLAGTALSGLGATAGLYLTTGYIWSGFAGMVTGTLLALMPLSALAAALAGVSSRVIRGAAVVLWIIIGSHLASIRDSVGLVGQDWRLRVFEVVALLFPDLGYPDWRGWLVFGRPPAMAELITALVASAGLAWFLLEVSALWYRREIRAQSASEAGGGS